MKQTRKKYLLILLLPAVVYSSVSGQASGGIENYNFMGNAINYIWVPVIHHLGKNAVYSEFRYNYEEAGAASVYIGKNLVSKGTIESSITPAAGIVFGKYTGGSLALNSSFSYKKFVFCSQSQYTINAGNRAANFFYNWSDVYYQELQWLYTGLTVQQTMYRRDGMKTEAGILAGFIINKWTIPVYLLNPLSKEKYFIIGINLEWRENNKK